jgi:hypothetical protein
MLPMVGATNRAVRHIVYFKLGQSFSIHTFLTAGLKSSRMKDYLIATIAFLVFGFLAMFAAYLALARLIPSPGYEIMVIALALLAGIHSFRASLKSRRGKEISATIQQTPPSFKNPGVSRLESFKEEISKGGQLVSATLIGLVGLAGVLISVVCGFLILVVAHEKPTQKMVEIIFLALLFMVSAYCCCFALGGRHVGQQGSGMSEAGRWAMATFLRACGLLGIAISLFAELVIWAFAAGKPGTKIGDGCLWGLVLVICVVFALLGRRFAPRNS